MPIFKEQKELHPDYIPKQAYFDVGVIFLPDALEFNETVFPICLPEEPNSDHSKYKDFLLRLMGKLRGIFKFQDWFISSPLISKDGAFTMPHARLQDI